MVVDPNYCLQLIKSRDSMKRFENNLICLKRFSRNMFLIRGRGELKEMSIDNVLKLSSTSILFKYLKIKNRHDKLNKFVENKSMLTNEILHY